MLKKIALVTCLALGAGCAVGARGTVVYSDPEPELLYVSPGVSVVADYDYPVFYADNYYWRYDGGIWYRSNNYRTGWVGTRNVPVTVARVERPHTYVHYRSGAVVRRGPTVRDHRYNQRRR